MAWVRIVEPCPRPFAVATPKLGTAGLDGEVDWNADAGGKWERRAVERNWGHRNRAHHFAVDVSNCRSCGYVKLEAEHQRIGNHGLLSRWRRNRRRVGRVEHRHPDGVGQDVRDTWGN